MATVLLLHGFPQTSHAWRDVVGPRRDAGHWIPGLHADRLVPLPFDHVGGA